MQFDADLQGKSPLLQGISRLLWFFENSEFSGLIRDPSSDFTIVVVSGNSEYSESIKVFLAMFCAFSSQHVLDDGNARNLLKSACIQRFFKVFPIFVTALLSRAVRHKFTGKITAPSRDFAVAFVL